jgi:plastocyanin
VFGLALMSAAFLTVLLVSLALLDGGDFLGFTIGVTFVSVFVTFLVWRFDALWSRIVGIVASVLMALSSFWLAFGVFTPFSPLEFVVALAFVLGVVISLVGGTRAIVAGRSGRVGQTTAEGRLAPVVLGVLGIAAVVSVVGLFVTRTTVSEADAAGATRLDMVDFEFDPDTAAVPVGGSLLLTNSDIFNHDFTLDELDISVNVGPGSEVLIDIAGATPGTYDYVCSIHSDGTTGMRGTIIIES